MQYRRAIPDDAPAIEAAEELIFPDPWNYRSVLTAITQHGSMCYVVRADDGELLAYLLGRTIVPEGEIYRIATLPEHRKRGIGYRLLDYAMKTERGRGLESTFLEVREKNTAARNLYRAYGFSEIGRRRGYYKNPDDDAVVMLLTDSQYLNQN